jgi:hypothetical protein
MKNFFLCMMMVGSGVFVQSIPAYASTEVTSDISSTTTWTLEGSPYLITGDVTVIPDVTLTISPGVTLKFASGARLQMVGTIRAEGTAASHISFIPDSEEEILPFDFWDGIFVLPNSSFTCTYCDISHAQVGIDSNVASSTLSHVRVFKSGQGLNVNYSIFTLDDS